MSYWSALIDGESRSVWMRRLSAHFSIPFEEERWGQTSMAAQIHEPQAFWDWNSSSVWVLVYLMSQELFLYRSLLLALSVCSHALGQRPDASDWSANAEGSNVTLAQCWQMQPLHQRQEKQQGLIWSTSPAWRRDLSHRCQVTDRDQKFTSDTHSDHNFICLISISTDGCGLSVEWINK